MRNDQVGGVVHLGFENIHANINITMLTYTCAPTEQCFEMIIEFI